MPLLTVYTSRPHPADAAAMLKSLSALVAQELQRSESYVMTMLVADVYIEFANPPGHLWGHDGGTFE